VLNVDDLVLRGTFGEVCNGRGRKERIDDNKDMIISVWLRGACFHPIGLRRDEI